MEKLKCRSCSTKIKCGLIQNAQKNNKHILDVILNSDAMFQTEGLTRNHYGYEKGADKHTVWMFSGKNLVATINRKANKRDFVWDGIGVQKWKIFCPQVKTKVFELFAEKDG